MIIAIIISVLFSLMMGEAMVFLIALGAICGIMGFLNLLIGLIFIPIGNNEKMKAFFISAGVLFLLGVGICGPMLAFG